MKKYEIIIHDITSDIASGKFQSGDQLLTENEMTEKYNVSKITIIKALNTLVHKGVIERIAGKGTFVKTTSPALKTSKSKGIIGCMFFTNNPEINLIYQGIESVLTANDFLTTIRFTNENPTEEINIIRSLMNSVDGIIAYPSFEDETVSLYQELIYKNFPVIFLDRSPSNFACTCVLTNGLMSSFMSVQALVQNGHRNIGFYSRNSLDMDVLKERYAGFINAMDYFGIKFNSSNLILGEFHDTPDNQARCISRIKSLLSQSGHPSAMVCINDISAYDILNCAVDLGVKVPEDLSVIGNDDNVGSRLVYPPLTTVGQPFEEIGRTAANEILKILANDVGIRQRIYLPPTYVERSTVSKCKEC